MAKTGGAVAKLSDKSKRNALVRRMGSHKPLITRTNTPHNDKAIAFLEHKRAIHGLVVSGHVVDEGGRNPGPAETFRGDGLPDEVIHGSKNWRETKPPKTMAERAAEDKRAPTKREVRDGWRPRPYQRQPDCVELALTLIAR